MEKEVARGEVGVRGEKGRVESEKRGERKGEGREVREGR